MAAKVQNKAESMQEWIPNNSGMCLTAGSDGLDGLRHRLASWQSK